MAASFGSRGLPFFGNMSFKRELLNDAFGGYVVKLRVSYDFLFTKLMRMG